MKLVSLGFRTDVALLQGGGSEVEDRGDHLVVRSPHNPTHWWGNFLLLAEVPAPESSAAWLDRFADAFPGAMHLALGFDRTHGSVEDLGWFEKRGFNAEAQTVMTTTKVHQPDRFNAEAVCRRLQSDDDWAESIELRMRCDDRFVDRESHRKFVVAKTETNRDLVEAGRGAWFGAFLDGHLVSQMGLFSAGTGLARFQSVETDPDFRRQGLAGSLVHSVSRYGLEVLRARTLVMVADPNYFAIDLYRAVGFVAGEAQLQVERVPSGSML
jgi:ribosomal protein S18 acetylase RimI-like enzyme